MEYPSSTTMQIMVKAFMRSIEENGQSIYFSVLGAHH